MAEFVGPGMNDGVTVEVVEIGGEPVFEFGLGCDTDVAEHRAGHLGREALNEVEPRAVLWGEHEARAPVRLSCEPGLVSSVMWAE